MAKKRFTDGLESIFDDATDSFKEERVVLVDAKPKKPEKVKRTRARGSSKDFTADLDSLLEEALRESSDRSSGTGGSSAAEASRPKKAARQTPPQRQALSGLDALIRKTIQVKVKEEDRRSPTKRVTLSVDKEKLERLKRIARVENAYLKDILSRIISEYLRKYEEGEDF